MPELDTSPPDLESEAAAFLRLEFEAQRDMRGNLNSLVAAESNIFVAIVAATFLGLSFLGQAIVRETAVIDRQILYVAAIGVLLVDYLLGWSTFRRVVSSRTTVVRYARTMNRTRRYFIERYPDVAMYVSPDICDDRPPMGSVGSSRPFLDVLSGNTGLIAILASACAGALAGGIVAAVGDAGVDFVPNADQGWAGALFIGASVLAAFIVSMIAFERHATRRFDEEELRWNAHFPCTEPTRKN